MKPKPPKRRKRKLRECWVWWLGKHAFFAEIGDKPKPRQFADEDGCIHDAAGRWVLMREVRR